MTLREVSWVEPQKKYGKPSTGLLIGTKTDINKMHEQYIKWEAVCTIANTTQVLQR